MAKRRGKPPAERYMTVLGGYQLDMHNQGELVSPGTVKPSVGKDYGCDPIGNGMFRMVPSGDIVDYEERNRRLGN
jgi:hypothetical protein